MPSRIAAAVIACCFARVAVIQAAEAKPPVTATVIDVAKIWDAAPHNAFTDLVRFQDQWFCAFREGDAHVSPHGKLRVIRSTDGESWESVALLEHSVFDLRDACLSVMPDGRLMLLGGAQLVHNGNHPTGTVAAFSKDGAQWTEPRLVLPLPRWLWRVTWNGDRAYGMAYGGDAGVKTFSLETTTDGLAYETIAMSQPAPHGGGFLTEARIRFAEDGTAYCLQRRDGKENTALMGVAAPPYKSWNWQDLGVYFGGPNFLQSPAGVWIGAGRIISDKARTEVVWLDPAKGRLTPLVRLPSGGDCSYPGMVWHDGLLWISYYSSHEGKASIYLAKVKINQR